MKDKIDNRKSDITPDFEFDEIDNDELVSACVEAEGAEEIKFRMSKLFTKEQVVTDGKMCAVGF